jgi:hypothetical protein
VTTSQSVAVGPMLRIMLVLAAFHLPWPGLGSVFAGYFGSVAGWLLHFWSAPGLQLQLLPAAPAGPEWSVLFDALDTATSRQVRAVLDVRRVGWLPLGAFSALLVAFPVRRWRRRLLVAAAGLLGLHALTVLPVLAYFGDAKSGLFELGGISHDLVVMAERALLTLPGMAYAAPALLWLLLSWNLEPELM